MEQHTIPATKTIFSGLLNQQEFLQRLHFINTRIGNSYTTEETAFLLGRTSYFLKDYEELASTKLDVEDIIQYTYLFKERIDLIYQFDAKVDKMDITHEKRVVRGEKSISDGMITYQFIHPWTSKGACKPILLHEPIQMQMVQTDVQLQNTLSILVRRNYFDVMRSPMEIYKKVNDLYQPQHGVILPLKNALYELVYSKQLYAKQHLHKISFTNVPA